MLRDLKEKMKGRRKNLKSRFHISINSLPASWKNLIRLSNSMRNFSMTSKMLNWISRKLVKKRMNSKLYMKEKNSWESLRIRKMKNAKSKFLKCKLKYTKTMKKQKLKNKTLSNSNKFKKKTSWKYSSRLSSLWTNKSKTCSYLKEQFCLKWS